MVITGVADRVADRIGRLVYLDAANPRQRPVAARRGRSGHRGGPPLRRDRRRDGARAPPGARRRPALRGHRPRRPGLDGRAPDRLTPGSASTQPLELTNEAALWAIPQYHIVCTSTLATRDPDLMAQARAEGRLWDIDTGHDLMITEPEKVAEALLQVAGGLNAHERRSLRECRTEPKRRRGHHGEEGLHHGTHRARFGSWRRSCSPASSTSPASLATARGRRRRRAHRSPSP